MQTATVTLTVTVDDLSRWESRQDLADTIRATLQEIATDDGDVVVPTVEIATIDAEGF